MYEHIFLIYIYKLSSRRGLIKYICLKYVMYLALYEKYILDTVTCITYILYIYKLYTGIYMISYVCFKYLMDIG